MKKTLYSKEFLKMQKLAGVITEGQYKTLTNESFQKGDDIGFHLLNYLEDRTSVGDKEAEEIYNANFAGDEEKEIEYKDSNDLTPEDIAILKTYVEKKAKEGDKAALKLMSDMESNS
jgi:N-acetylglucosamine kinase-like BadF-type ATPase